MLKCFYVLLILLTIVIFISCVEIMPPSATIDYKPGIEANKITSVAVSIFQTKGFVVSVVDPDVGIVVTDWKRVSDTRTESFHLAMVGERYQRRMRVSLIVNQDLRQISIKTAKEMHTNQAGWQEINLDEDDKTILKSIAKELAGSLGLPLSSVTWTDPLATEILTTAPPISKQNKILTSVAFVCFAAFIFAGFLAYNA